MSGFIAAVNTSAVVSSGATELYYLSYLYGFCASGLVFVALHKIFPARSLDNFVKNGVSAEETRHYYRTKWDNIGYENQGPMGDNKIDETITVNDASAVDRV